MYILPQFELNVKLGTTFFYQIGDPILPSIYYIFLSKKSDVSSFCKSIGSLGLNDPFLIIKIIIYLKQLLQNIGLKQ